MILLPTGEILLISSPARRISLFFWYAHWTNNRVMEHLCSFLTCLINCRISRHTSKPWTYHQYVEVFPIKDILCVGVRRCSMHVVGVSQSKDELLGQVRSIQVSNIHRYCVSKYWRFTKIMQQKQRRIVNNESSLHLHWLQFICIYLGTSYLYIDVIEDTIR